MVDHNQGVGKGNKIDLKHEIRFHSIDYCIPHLPIISALKSIAVNIKSSGLAPYGEPKYVITSKAHHYKRRWLISIEWLLCFDYGMRMYNSSFEQNMINSSIDEANNNFIRMSRAL